MTRSPPGRRCRPLPIWIFGNLFRPNQAPVINVVAAALTLIAAVPVWLAQRVGGDRRAPGSDRLRFRRLPGWHHFPLDLLSAGCEVHSGVVVHGR